MQWSLSQPLPAGHLLDLTVQRKTEGVRLDQYLAGQKKALRGE